MQERTCYSANNHFKFAYPEQAKAIIPLGGPVWAMIEPYSDYTYVFVFSLENVFE